MFAGLFLGCVSWSGNVYLRAQGSQHAAAAGIGHGEYSAMIANFRCEQARKRFCLLAQAETFPSRG